MSLVLGSGTPKIWDLFLELGSGDPKTRDRLKHKNVLSWCLKAQKILKYNPRLYSSRTFSLDVLVLNLFMFGGF